jgi:hypothetical protein
MLRRIQETAKQCIRACLRSDTPYLTADDELQRVNREKRLSSGEFQQLEKLVRQALNRFFLGFEERAY